VEKYPAPERVTREVTWWDPDRKEWVSGVKTTFRGLPATTVIEWTNKSAATDISPDEDKEVDVEAAESVAIQASTTDPNNTATSVDVNVETSLDGVTWDTTPYAEMNLGDAEIKTMLIEPGPFKIRVRIDNNTGGSRADVRVIVKVRE